MKSVWLPEAQPEHPAVYAPKDYKIGINTSTTDPWKAMQFETEEECQEWCDNNPFPKFVPVSHGFAEDGEP
jgi:hypothetical protein